MRLKDKISSKKAIVSVIGMGYVGLPLAVELSKVRFMVKGIDIKEEKVDLVNSGRSDVADVGDEELSKMVSSGFLLASTDFAILKESDVVNICVPTPLSKTKDPDVSFILNAVSQIKKYLHPDQLVVLESTTYPGTTEELILPILEETGLKAGQDFFLAFSPERIDPGNPVYKVKNTPRVVGGVTPECTKIATVFYQQFIDKVLPVSSSKSAEMVKLLENTFRSVNIGLVNEVALMCDRLGIDVWEIIDAAASKPFGYMPFYPGPGLGGHCIPIDPHYLSWKLKTLNYYARFIELAGDINSSMPYYVLGKVGEVLNGVEKSIKGSHILCLGVAYKRDIGDIRESPALDVLKLLSSKGARVSYNDPYVPKLALNGHTLHSQELEEDLLKGTDCVVIVTDHSSYDYNWIVKNSRLVVDTRNATRGIKEGREKITKI